MSIEYSLIVMYYSIRVMMNAMPTGGQMRISYAMHSPICSAQPKEMESRHSPCPCVWYIAPSESIRDIFSGSCSVFGPRGALSNIITFHRIITRFMFPQKHILPNTSSRVWHIAHIFITFDSFSIIRFHFHRIYQFWSFYCMRGELVSI